MGSGGPKEAPIQSYSQRCISKTSRATVRRAMTQRATRTRHVTLDFNARQGSRVKVAQHCGMCDIGLNGGAYPLRDLYETFRVCGQFLPRWPLKFERIRSMVPEL